MLSLFLRYRWIYRESGAKYMPKSHIMKAEIIGAIMWWWILYHIWTEPEHILVRLII